MDIQSVAITSVPAEGDTYISGDFCLVAKQGPGFTLLKRRWVVEQSGRSIAATFSSSCPRCSRH